MSLPTDSTARKRIPMFSGLLKYFPDALAAVAELSFKGNEKHNPGEPLHWSKEKSNDHEDCIIRHMTDLAGGNREARVEVAWRALAALQINLEEEGPIDVARVYDRRTAEWPHVRHHDEPQYEGPRAQEVDTRFFAGHAPELGDECRCDQCCPITRLVESQPTGRWRF